jgi:hypothetical protein
MGWAHAFPSVRSGQLGRLFRRRIRMSHNERELQSADLRQLAAKCRRLATELYDAETVATLRQMAADYDRLAYSKEQESRPAPQRMPDA